MACSALSSACVSIQASVLYVHYHSTVIYNSTSWQKQLIHYHTQRSKMLHI